LIADGRSRPRASPNVAPSWIAAVIWAAPKFLPNWRKAAHADNRTKTTADAAPLEWVTQQIVEETTFNAPIWGFATGNKRRNSLSQFIDPVHVREGVDVAKRARYPLRCFPRETFLSDWGPKPYKAEYIRIEDKEERFAW
jgi:hypothetical protein